MDVYLYDEIGFYGTTAADFVSELATVKTAEIVVHISSQGGDIFEGLAIYNALRTHSSPVTTKVDSLAASIASVIAQAGDRRLMLTGSQMMIHKAHGLAMGDDDDMEEMAALLRKQTDNIAGIYAERAGGTSSKPRFLSLMKNETWMTPTEALDEGLVDEVIKPAKAKQENKVDWAGFVASLDVIGDIDSDSVSSKADRGAPKIDWSGFVADMDQIT